MSALCHNCGTQIDEDTLKFCPACGAWENAIPCTPCPETERHGGCKGPCDKYNAWLRENPAKKAVPGLTVHYAEDGCYLRFKSRNGSEVCLNLNTIAADCGPLTEKTLLQWIEDTKPRDKVP